MTKRRTTLIQKDSSKRTTPNDYRPITCLPMMWKILTAQIREEIYDSLTSRGLFPDEQKGCCEESRGTAEFLYIDQPIRNESKTRPKKSSNGLNWLQKDIWYSPAMLDYKLPQNVQNIRWSKKLYQENHENLESGFYRWRKKLGWNKDPKRYISRRCTITITIHNCHDATSPHT